MEDPHIPADSEPLTKNQIERLVRAAMSVKSGRARYLLVKRKGSRLKLQTLKLDINDSVD